MPAEPSKEQLSTARREAGGSVLRAGVAETRSGATSPLRWLLVIVPLIVIAAAASNLAGLWGIPQQQAAREETKRQAPSGAPKSAPIRTGDHPGRGSEKAPTRAEGFDIGAVLALIATAKPEDGASVFRMCTACHTAEKNGPHRVGSNLWGIVGARKASLPGFSYSATLRAKGGTWTYRELAEYLHDPRKFAPGTSMAFVGIADQQRLANLIAYLRTLADSPAPLP